MYNTNFCEVKIFGLMRSFNIKILIKNTQHKNLQNLLSENESQIFIFN